MRKKKKETTLDDVLHATKQGFDAMEKKFAAVEMCLAVAVLSRSVAGTGLNHTA